MRFECLKPRWNTKHEFLKLLLQQKKISLNYEFYRDFLHQEGKIEKLSQTIT